MTLYHDTYQAILEEVLPEPYQQWIEERMPCQCHEAWTGRGMHANDCRWVFAIDVLAELDGDGLLHPAPVGRIQQIVTGQGAMKHVTADVRLTMIAKLVDAEYQPTVSIWDATEDER